MTSIGPLALRSQEISGAATSANVPVAFAELVLAAMNAPIRAMQPERMAVELGVQLLFVAREYGARHDIPAETLAECVKLVNQKFGSLGIAEIREAYRMAAAREIKADEMWGGQFSAAQLGSVLSAYKEHRRKVVAELSRAQTEQRRRLEWAKRIASAKGSMVDNFWGLVHKLRERAKYWGDVPPMYWEMAKSLDLVTLTKEDIARIMAAAKEQAPIERKRRGTPQSYAMRDIFEARAANDTDDDTLVKEIAGKMAFYELFLAAESVTQ